MVMYIYYIYLIGVQLEGFAAALLLLYYCFTTALLLLYYCFTTALLLLLYTL
jgi:hypothetical protein